MGADLSDVFGVDPTRQWLFEHETHPYCLWIEYYDKGRERRDAEEATGLTGPQFMVVESVFCEPVPGPYA